jgi:predicted nucleic acid-binding protein
VVGISVNVFGEVVYYSTVKNTPVFLSMGKLLNTSKGLQPLEHIKQSCLKQIMPYPILERYADIRRTLRPQHKDIGDIDTLIAATALEHGLTFITIDRDFERVPHLQTKLVNLKAAE